MASKSEQITGVSDEEYNARYQAIYDTVRMLCPEGIYSGFEVAGPMLVDIALQLGATREQLLLAVGALYDAMGPGGSAPRAAEGPGPDVN